MNEDKNTPIMCVKEVERIMGDFNREFAPAEYEERPICIPGIGDIFLRHVTRLGYKGEFPRPYDWENLLPQLRMDEELLWIVRKTGSKFQKGVEESSGLIGIYAFDVYLGLKYVGGDQLSREEWENRGKRFAAFTRNFARSAFPETTLKKDMGENDIANFLSEIDAMIERRIVVGMPSIKDAELRDVAAKRDERVRPYAGLNDILEMHCAPEDDFAIVFAVSKASDSAILNNFSALFTIQSEIKPKIEKAVQYTEGKSLAISVSDTYSTTKGFTNVIPGGRRQLRKQRGLIPRTGRGIMNIWRWIGGTSGNSPKEIDNQDLRIQEHAQESEQTTEGHTAGNTTTENASKTWTVKEFNSILAFADERIKESLAQLTQTLGTGGYHCGVSVFSNDGYLAQSVAESVRAVMSGGQSALLPMRIFEFELPENRDWLLRKKSLARVFEEDAIPCGIMNCEKACLYLPVPTTHLVGLPIKKNVFYGKDSPSPRESGSVSLGKMSFAELCISNETVTAVAKDRNRLELSMRNDDFYSHFFIVGTTGSGKTMRAAKILHDAQRFRRIILETAKKTYWNELEMEPEELLVYTLGDSTHSPLRFNPFYFEPGSNLKQHIAVLADAISDLLPMSALIGPKLREATERCYIACGWNIETSKREVTECNLEYPNVAMFKMMVKEIVNEMKDYGSETRGDYTGALMHRASIFMDAVYQDIFAFDGNKTIDELFPPDKTVIIEMEEMPPSEINMPAFIISLLLHRIRAYQSNAVRAGDLETKPGFLIAIEEAHNVLSKSIQQKGDETQSGKGGHLVKQVTRLLAEGRGMKIGMMIIDQSSANIAPSVITNTNTKLVFRQEDGTEIETIGKAIGLKKEEWNDLQLLGTGEYLIRNEKYPHPVKMAPFPKEEVKRIKNERDGKHRDSFVREATWTPNYHALEKLLASYLDACRVELADGQQGTVTLSYEEEADKLSRALCTANDCIKEDLRMYCIVKILMQLELYEWAYGVLGIDMREASED